MSILSRHSIKMEMKEKIVNYVVVEVKKTHRKLPAVSFVPKSASQTTPSTAVQLPAATFSQRPTPKPRGDSLWGVVGRDTQTTPGGATLQAPPTLGGTTLGGVKLGGTTLGGATLKLGGTTLGGATLKLGGTTLGGALTTTPMPSTILGGTAQIPPTLHGTPLPTLGGAIPAPARSSGIERSQVPQRQFGQPFAPVVQQVTATTQSSQPPQDKKTSSPPIFKIVNVVVKSSIR